MAFGGVFLISQQLFLHKKPQKVITPHQNRISSEIDNFPKNIEIACFACQTVRIGHKTFIRGQLWPIREGDFVHHANLSSQENKVGKQQ